MRSEPHVNQTKRNNMSDLTVHASYQDSSIPYLATTRLPVTVGSIDFIAYTYKDEVYLNLSQVANVVNKTAISLFDFCARNTQESLMGDHSSNEHFQAYTTDQLQKRGKDPRIVHVNVAHLYWADQAMRAGNKDAFKVAISCSREAFILKVREKQQPVLPTRSPKYDAMLVQAYKDALRFQESLDYLSDKPGLAAKMEMAHQPKALDSWMFFDELCTLANVAITNAGQRAKMAARVAIAYQNDTHTSLPKGTFRFTSKSGKCQKTIRTQYNTACVSYLHSAVSSK